MNGQDRTEEQLVVELAELRGRLAKLEASATDRVQEQAALREPQLYQPMVRVDPLQVLNQLDQALITTLDAREIAEATLTQIAAALDAPVGLLVMLSAQDDVSPDGAFSLQEGWIGPAVPGEERQSLRAAVRELHASHWAVSVDCDGLARWGLPVAQPGAKGQDAVGLAIPVREGGQLVAALVLAGRPPKRPFTAQERALAQAAAARAAYAFRHARLYESIQQQSARLTMLSSISAAAVSSLELDTMLYHVLGVTCDALHAAEGSILLKDQDTGELFFVLSVKNGENQLRGWRLPPGQGIAGWVALHGRPVRSNDVTNDPRWYGGVDEATGFETGSLMCAPLRHQGQTTGVIEVVNRRDGEFTEDDLDLLEAVASIAAAALENTRLYQVTRSYADELAMLYETGLELTSAVDLSSVVSVALSRVQRLFRAEYVALLQTDPGTGELYYVRALAGTRPIEIPVRLQRGMGIAGRAFESGRPVLIQDVQEDSRWVTYVDWCLGSRMRALMVAPLLTSERAIGVLEVGSEQAGVYTRGEMRTLQSLASTLAVALEKASLYEELRTLLREREQAQARLIHSEKMTALGTLVASIAHEISNPFQAMQTYLTLADEELAGEQRLDKLTRYLGTVSEEIDRIANILRRLREFYRPAQVQWRPTDLHAVLDSVLELTRRQLQHSGVQVHCAWAEGLQQIEARPDHLKQVFLNLVLNAIDAMPDGGELHVSTALDQIESPAGGQSMPAVRIEFSDTGLGMLPTEISHVFEPFFTTKAQGAGLGLSTSYGIIQAHNGQITVSSQVDLGTIFTILLPMVQSDRVGRAVGF